MNIKKIFLFGIVIVAAIVVAYGAFRYFTAEKYEIQQIELETKNLNIYTDGGPIKTISIDAKVPKKSANDATKNQKPDIKVWIE